MRATPAFVDPPREKGATWLAPRLVAQVSFTSGPPTGGCASPVFLGLRDDKNAAEVRAAGEAP